MYWLYLHTSALSDSSCSPTFPALQMIKTRISWRRWENLPTCFQFLNEQFKIERHKIYLFLPPVPAGANYLNWFFYYISSGWEFWRKVFAQKLFPRKFFFEWYLLVHHLTKRNVLKVDSKHEAMFTATLATYQGSEIEAGSTSSSLTCAVMDKGFCYFLGKYLFWEKS